MVIARCTKGESYCARHYPKPCPPSFKGVKGNGNYWCGCVHCDEMFFGGKYDLVCPDCRIALAAAARQSGDVQQAPAESPQSGPAKQGNAQTTSTSEVSGD